GPDDGRDSPALDVAQTLTGMGARVTVYDPAALDNARRARPELSYAPTLAAAAQGAHVVLLLTEWPEFTALTPGSLGGIVARRNIVDARNALDRARWRGGGGERRALGVAEEAAAPARLAPSPCQARAAARRAAGDGVPDAPSPTGTGPGPPAPLWLAGESLADPARSPKLHGVTGG